ncbi:MAG: hypothetical protein ABSC25_17175 [Roseiarcus sp.]|jgi:hypothetical protein
MSYISDLNASVVREQARRDEEAQVAKQAALNRLTSLDDRLKKLLATIPIEAQREGLSLSSLRILLRGRQGGNAHCGELGEALRNLHFERRRDWSGRGGRGGFATRWYLTR